MKTRIIQTRFWDDLFVSDSDIYTQHLYIYLLTSQYINLCGIFQLPESKIKFECKLTDNQFQTAKENLERAKKVLFKDGWVYVVNAERNNNYKNSPKIEPAYNREYSLIPQQILDFFDSTMDSSIDSTIYSTHKSKTINQNTKIINKSFNKIEDITNPVLEEIAEKYEVSVGFVENCWDTAQNWLESSGKTKKNYKAFLSNWVKSEKGKEVQNGKPRAIDAERIIRERKMGSQSEQRSLHS